MPVADGGGSLTVDGTVAVSGTVTVSDGAGSLTVDGTVAVSNMVAAVETGLAKDATLTTRLPAALDADGGVKVHVQSAVPVTDNGGSITVDGTFWQATQPTSLAALPTLPSGDNVIGRVKLTDGTNVATVKAASTAAVATDTAQVVSLSPNSPLPAGSSVLGKVQNQDGSGNNIETTVKGTQASRALATQEIHDTGRTLVVATAEAVAGVNADTIVSSFSVNRGGAVTASVTSINVTAGKTFRVLQVLVGYMVVTATTPPWLRVRARYNSSGAAVIGSGMLASLRVGPAAVVANHTTWTNMEIPEGMELVAGSGLAFSVSGPATTPTNGNVDIVVVGYEY